MNPYCLAPWTNLQYSGMYEGGGWRGDKFKGAIKDYTSSEYLNKIKQQMIDHDMQGLAKSCQDCIKNEKFGKESQRQLIERKSEQHDQFETYWRIDYRPTNLCNLKCRMCSPYSSS